MSAIYKRELRADFSSPMGYIIVAAILAILDMGYFILLNAQVIDVGFMLAYLNVPCLILIPIMQTMRLLSEERNRKNRSTYFDCTGKSDENCLGKIFCGLYRIFGGYCNFLYFSCDVFSVCSCRWLCILVTISDIRFCGLR